MLNLYRLSTKGVTFFIESALSKGPNKRECTASCLNNSTVIKKANSIKSEHERLNIRFKRSTRAIKMTNV